VFIVTGEPFYTDGSGTHELRLCFSARPPDVAARAAVTLGRSLAAATKQAATPEALNRLV
jgi:hypothetical protein